VAASVSDAPLLRAHASSSRVRGGPRDGAGSISGTRLRSDRSESSERARVGRTRIELWWSGPPVHFRSVHGAELDGGRAGPSHRHRASAAESKHGRPIRSRRAEVTSAGNAGARWMTDTSFSEDPLIDLGGDIGWRLQEVPSYPCPGTDGRPSRCYRRRDLRMMRCSRPK